MRRHWMEQPVMLPDSTESLSARSTRRRLVLLGESESVIAEPPAHKFHAELRILMAMHPSVPIAGEYLTERGWVRFIVGRQS